MCRALLLAAGLLLALSFAAADYTGQGEQRRLAAGSRLGQLGKGCTLPHPG